MKRLLSTSYSETAFNISTFLLRAAFGFLLCLDHGVPKIVHFSEWQHNFYDPFHIGHRWSLVLAIFAEVFASLLLILGLFSRIAALILVIEFLVIIFIYQRGQPVKNFEEAALFGSVFLCILLIGPGRLSVDAMTGR